MADQTIAFIGGGNMARCLIAGLIGAGYNANNIIVSDPHPEKLTQLRALFGVRTVYDNQTAAATADIILFAVKPQKLQEAASGIRDIVQLRNPLVISIAAGVREEAISRWLGHQIAVVRCMPNTPAMVGSAATGLYANVFVTMEQRNIAESIMRSVGITLWVDQEPLLDAVTALSGSGPAYFFLIMEALQQAAVMQGLSSDTARLLVLQTTLGAAKLAMESNETLAELREHVTSPHGTTERGIQILQAGHLEELLVTAFNAAFQRAKEMADTLSRT